ncbi:MAG: hypothetical protein Q8N51_06910, partial [Gammaproteobacteria bacterium]|nr:hypothetical protein [Gammaproteobacteria bacterium]
SRIVNVASPHSYPIGTIIAGAETVLGQKARLESIAAGAAYSIDIDHVAPLIAELGIQFDEDYLLRVISRYYA